MTYLSPCDRTGSTSSVPSPRPTSFDHAGQGTARVALNGRTVDGLTVGAKGSSNTVPLFLSAGINRLTVSGTTGTLLLDRVRTAPSNAPTNRIEAETGTLTGKATANGDFTFASGKVVTGVGDGPGNALTLKVTAQRAGRHVLVFRYANAEESIPTHYNPDPVSRHADISVNGGPAQRVLFPTTFHFNQFRDLTVPVDLAAGANSVTVTSQELPDWDGKSYNQFGQRSKYAPNIDYLTVAPLLPR